MPGVCRLVGGTHGSAPTFAGERRPRNAPANVADEPRACPQRGGVSPPNSSGTPDQGPLVGAAERIGSRRFANGRAVHRQTRRMEPPGCMRSEQSDVCESGGSSATFGPSMKLIAALLCAALLAGAVLVVIKLSPLFLNSKIERIHEKNLPTIRIEKGGTVYCRMRAD